MQSPKRIGLAFRSATGRPGRRNGIPAWGKLSIWSGGVSLRLIPEQILLRLAKGDRASQQVWWAAQRRRSPTPTAHRGWSLDSRSSVVADVD
ncbi:hypothetical protein VTN02DRAFT_5560 [Thermoascus thermophilus]